MTPSDDHLSRRRFLRFAAGSPLLAAAGIDLGALAALFAGGPRDRAKGLALLQQATQEPELIASAADALDVFDFEPVAKKKLPPAHWGYLSTGMTTRRFAPIAKATRTGICGRGVWSTSARSIRRWRSSASNGRRRS